MTAVRWLVAGLSMLAPANAAFAWSECFRLTTPELPRLGGVRGAWLTDERFVLVDSKRSRLIVYSVDGGFERSVRDLVAGPDVAADIEPWGDGFVLAESEFHVQRLRHLSAELLSVGLLWQSHRESSRALRTGQSSDVVDLFEVVAVSDRLYFLGRRPGGVVVELVPEADSSSESGLRIDAVWPAHPAELRFWRMPGLRVLARTSGPAAAAFALRFGDSVYIQQISGRERRLSAFPDMEGPLPQFPPAGWENLQAYYTILEASSYPAGLYAQTDSLYANMRTSAHDGEAVWDLYRIDPVADALIGRTRLPTRATHVSLLPGPKYWLMEESSSHFDDFFRKPTGLYALEADAIRSGDSISCN